MRVIQLPIEPLEERYSTQWRRWFSDYWPDTSETAFQDSCTLTDKIETGSFLDVYGTCYYKSVQMGSLIKMMKEVGFGKHEDDWIFFHDLWSPAVLNLAYIRDGAGLKFKIAGCLHAGCWDDNDFLTKQGMGVWAKDLEKSIMSVTDLVFVATSYHKRLLCQYFWEMPIANKIKLTGFPIYPDEFATEEKPMYKELDIVVFPHRKDEEKQPHLFEYLKSMIAETDQKYGFNFVFTKDVCARKQDYYDLLNKSQIAISFAKQETWGIAMQEAFFCGCVPFVPDRLSYCEMYDDDFRYRDLEDLVDKILDWRSIPKEIIERNKDTLKLVGEGAIENMEWEMRNYGS